MSRAITIRKFAAANIERVRQRVTDGSRVGDNRDAGHTFSRLPRPRINNVTVALVFVLKKLFLTAAG